MTVSCWHRWHGECLAIDPVGLLHCLSGVTIRGLSLAALVCGLVLLVGPSRGQGPNHSASKFYPDSSDPANTLLRNAAGHVRDGQWAEAIGIYQRVIDQYGDKVAELDRKSTRLNSSHRL